ncbi:MAG: sigma-54 dependent transcriptional regulator [Cytophagales bacterium]
MNYFLNIFLVDDDPWILEMFKHHLSLNPEYQIKTFTTAQQCIDNLYQKPDVICMDYGLPDMNGEKLLAKLQQYDKNMPVIVISGQEEVEVAVKILKSGAKDYIVKNEHSKELLWNALIKIKENLNLRKEIDELKEQLETKYSFEKTIIGQSDAIKKTYTLIEKAIKSNINISITGETGTGKEVVAKAIHFNSDRKKKPFVAVNMAAIPKELVESELFGYEKGAFTGAVNRKIGKFEEATGGTLFLDEIGELELNIQSKLLRALQEREIVRVGGNEKVKFDVRIITATHKNLSLEVKKGNFREDLFYRILGMPIELAPLRERGKDILILAKYFLDEYVRENKIKTVSLNDDSKNKLMKYPFPGNVRELKAIIELAAVMCDNHVIKPADLMFNNIRSEENFEMTDKTLKEFTHEIIFHYLKKYNNDVMKVAKVLDIGKSTIYNLLQSRKIENV